MAQRPVLQFKITLLGTKPAIWRRIQISDLCTFWDLHVAIQDAMGWLDCHLHHFQATEPTFGEPIYFGIPDEDGFDVNSTLPGWEYKVKNYIAANKTMRYEYDW